MARGALIDIGRVRRPGNLQSVLLSQILGFRGVGWNRSYRKCSPSQRASLRRPSLHDPYDQGATCTLIMCLPPPWLQSLCWKLLTNDLSDKMKNMPVKFDPSLAKESSRLCLKRKVKTKQTPILWIWWNAVCGMWSSAEKPLLLQPIWARDATMRAGLATESYDSTKWKHEDCCHGRLWGEL